MRFCNIATPTTSLIVTLSLAFVLTGCGGGSDADEPIVTVNRTPVSDAGPNQVVNLDSSTTINLDGSGSTDPEGSALTYQWTVVQGPAATPPTINNDTSEFASFVTTDVGSYIVVLQTSDGSKSSSSQVTVTAERPPPVSNAGSNQSVDRDTEVILDGSLSSDPTNDPLTYQWDILSGPSTPLITNADQVAPRFTPDVEGTYVLQLTVSDGTTDATSQVEITSELSATYSNLIPAGTNSNISVVDGPASIDFVSVYVNIIHPVVNDLNLVLESPDGTQINLSLENGSGPGVGAVGDANYTNTIFDDNSSISIAAAPTPFTGSFAPDELLSGFDNLTSLGDWQLSVVDVDPSPQIAIIVNWTLVLSSKPSTNLPPVTVAGPDQIVTTGSTVTLDGTASFDANVSDTLAYSWSIESDPAGGSVLDTTVPGRPTFTATVDGTYEFELLTNDGTDDSQVVDRVTIVSRTASSTHTPDVAIPVAGLTIPDGTYDDVLDVDVPGEVTSTITIGASPNITAISVNVDIAHEYTFDVDLVLESPDGTMVLLTRGNGLIFPYDEFSTLDDNFTDTTYDDAGAISINDSQAPFTGTFRPVEPLSILNGTDPAGVWTLHVYDVEIGVEGTLLNWSLDIY